MGTPEAVGERGLGQSIFIVSCQAVCPFCLRVYRCRVYGLALHTSEVTPTSDVTMGGVGQGQEHSLSAAHCLQGIETQEVCTTGGLLPLERHACEGGCSLWKCLKGGCRLDSTAELDAVLGIPSQLVCFALLSSNGSLMQS